MKAGWAQHKIDDFCLVTDYVANGSFASLKENVQYLDEPDFAMLVRYTDHAKGWNGRHKYVSESAYHFLKKSSLKPGDLIMANVGDPGKAFLLPDLGVPMTLGPNSILIRAEKYTSNEFLHYYFSSDDGRRCIDVISAGAAQKKFNKTAFRGLEIPLPPLEEQRRIVAILDEAFEGLDRAQENAEANLRNARELFSSVLDEVFSACPSHWTQSNLGATCTFVGGSQPPKSKFLQAPGEGLVRLIQIRDYKSDRNVVYIPRSLARRFCEEDDVMIGRYGPPLFQILRGIQGAYNVALMKAVPKPEMISKDFLYYFLQNGSIFQYINNASSRAAGQIGLNKATLEPYPISYPDASEQVEVVERLDGAKLQCDTAIEQYAEKLQDLDDLRQSLLQKAFAGELT